MLQCKLQALACPANWVYPKHLCVLVLYLDTLYLTSTSARARGGKKNHNTFTVTQRERERGIAESFDVQHVSRNTLRRCMMYVKIPTHCFLWKPAHQRQIDAHQQRLTLVATSPLYAIVIFSQCQLKREFALSTEHLVLLTSIQL